jgi:hypothetical protein
MISDKISDGGGQLGPSRRTPCFNITCNVVVLQQKTFFWQDAGLKKIQNRLITTAKTPFMIYV